MENEPSLIAYLVHVVHFPFWLLIIFFVDLNCKTLIVAIPNILFMVIVDIN